MRAKIDTQKIVKGIDAGLYLLNRNLRILWANKIIFNWFSFKEKDLCRKHCYKIFKQSRHICKVCCIPEVFKTGQTKKIVIAYPTKEGKKHYFQLVASPIKENNKVSYVLGFLQDISKTVKKDKDRLKLINKLKYMYQQLLVANKRLEKDIGKLKTLNKNTKVLKAFLENRYRKKIKEANRLKEELKDIIKVTGVVSIGSDLKKICTLVARLACKILHTQGCTLRLVDKEQGILVVKGGCGLSRGFLNKTPLKIGEGLNGYVVKTGRPIIVDDVKNDRRIKYPTIVKKENVCSALCVPIKFKGKVLGVISAYSKTPRHFSEEEMRLLTAFASQVAIAIKEAQDYEDIHMNYFNTIHALVLAVEARDPYTRGHTERVTQYAIEVARELKMPAEELEILRYAGEVHDVGKISIPDFILNKPGKLTPTEKAQVELHPIRGAEMLEPLEFLKPAIPIVRHHHERYDGAGYPDGLKRERIPILSRILACADAFDAMTSDRPYRTRRLTLEEALREIENNSGSQFDPNIAHLFIRITRRSRRKGPLVKSI